MPNQRTPSAQSYRTQRNASALVILFWIVAALIIFATSFVAFLVAPLLLTVLCGGGLYLQERLGQRRSRPANTPTAVTAPDTAPAGGYARYGDSPNPESGS